MLLGNYSVLSKSPGRFLAGSTTSVEGQVRSNWNKSGMQRARIVQDRGGSSTALYKYAEPTGYYQPYTWMFPQTSGEIGSTKFITGSGTVASGNLAGGLNAVAPLTGAGDISSAVAALIVSAVANLTGSGTVSSAALNAIQNAIASLTGSGDASATILAKGIILAAIVGTGTTGGSTISASGVLAAGIKAYTDLTAQGAADAVWAQILETGYSAEDILRLFAAALAGKVSGAAGPTITFRDINDTIDRIVADVDSSGNRTTVTLDPN